MNYASILDCDVANGLGWRISLFVSGCTLHCPGCFNSQAWDFKYGKLFTKHTEDKIIELLAPDYVKGLSLLGGNPTELENEEELIPFCKRVKMTYPDKDIWMWSGHTYEQLIERNDQLLPLCDVLIEGPFIQEKKDLTLPFRGSSNQRILDVKKKTYNEEKSGYIYDVRDVEDELNKIFGSNIDSARYDYDKDLGDDVLVIMTKNLNPTIISYLRDALNDLSEDHYGLLGFDEDVGDDGFYSRKYTFYITDGIDEAVKKTKSKPMSKAKLVRLAKSLVLPKGWIVQKVYSKAAGEDKYTDRILLGVPIEEYMSGNFRKYHSNINSILKQLNAGKASNEYKWEEFGGGTGGGKWYDVDIGLDYDEEEGYDEEYDESNKPVEEAEFTDESYPKYKAVLEDFKQGCGSYLEYVSEVEEETGSIDDFLRNLIDFVNDIGNNKDLIDSCFGRFIENTRKLIS